MIEPVLPHLSSHVTVLAESAWNTLFVLQSLLEYAVNLGPDLRNPPNYYTLDGRSTSVDVREKRIA